MRIYLAAPWVDRDLATAAAKKIEAVGHTITHPWWQYEGENQQAESEAFLIACAKNDVIGVETADVVIVINTNKSEGKAVEQGIAIAHEKPIICITPGEKPTYNIFHHLSNYRHVKSLEEALDSLGQYE